MNNKIFSNNSIWFRQQYEIINVHGIDYIVIKKGAEKEAYSPLEQEILYSRPKDKLEHMKSTPHVALSRIDPENYNDILLFVNSWGLLGLKHTKEYTDEIRLAEIFKVPRFGRDFQETRDLYQDYKSKSGEKNREPILVFQQAVRDYQQIILDLDEYWKYQLPNVFNSKMNKSDFVKNMLLNENSELYQSREQSVKQKAIESEMARALIPFLRLNKMVQDISPQAYWSAQESKVTMGWKFSSLLSANYLRVLLDFNEGSGFIQCKWKNCRKFFIPRNPANQYCDEKCRNSDNTYRHKLSIWLNNIKSQFPNQPEQEIEEIFNSLVEDGYSGEKKILKLIQQRLK